MPSVLRAKAHFARASRGDGLEKAFTMANVLRERDPEARIIIEKGPGNKVAVIQKGKTGNEFVFESRKRVEMPVEKDFD